MRELPGCEREFIRGFIPVNNFSISDLFDLRESGRLWVCNVKYASKAGVWNFSLMRRPNKSGEGAVGMYLLQCKGKLFMRVRQN